MVAGTYIETDQIRNAFEDITAQSVEKLDVVVTPDEEFTSQVVFELPVFDANVVEAVQGVSGVGAAQGELTAPGHLVVDGEFVETMGAPAMLTAVGDARFDPSETVEGRRPEALGEVSIFSENAEDNGIALGDVIGIATRSGTHEATVVGIIEFGGAAVGGATMAGATMEQVQAWSGLEDEITSVSVIADAGVSSSDLAGRIQAVVPQGIRSQTASENAEETADQVNDTIGAFLTPALLALAGAAVLVGAFIIFNTFSITVAQRSREFAMLRALGATRGQILASVAAEALLIGLIASAIGLVAGLGFASLINALFDAAGFGIPRSGLSIAPRTIAVAACVGVGVTVLSAFVPALRATRVAPIAAMSRVPAAPSARARRIGLAITALFLACGLALTIQGLFGSGSADSRLGGLASGAILLFIGVALSARHFVGPIARVIGFPIEKLFGTPGKIARENAERNPSRTAVTSAALMVGLGLVVFVAVFAAGIKSSIAGQIDDLVRAEFVMYGPDFQPFPAEAREPVAEVPGVEAAVPLVADQLEVNGQSSSSAVDIVIGTDFSQLTEVYAFDWIEGEDSLLGSIGHGEALIEEQFAERHSLDVGDSYQAVNPNGRQATLTAVGVYRDPNLIQGSVVSEGTFRDLSSVTDATTMVVSVADGADAAAVGAEIEAAIASRYPTVTVESKAEYKDTIEGQLDQIVYLLYALLAMSVLISMFGIANSLFLSIHERTGELGVLRAIGATTTQVRRVIRYESVITSIIGGLMGTAVGILFGWLVIQSLSDFGFKLSIPVGQLAIFMLVAVLVGVIGAIRPARRASEVDVLDAVRHE